MSFWAKKFKIKDHLLVAICDENLLDKEVKTSEIKVKINKNFYGGEKIDRKKAIYLMSKCTIANLIGKDIIKLALEENFIAKQNIILIGGIPHAQFIQ